MDIKKEREAFEIQFRNTKQYISILHFIEMGAAGSHQDIHSVFQRCDFNEDEYAHSSVQSGWLMWQAAKAQAVPDLSELQERIAGHQYYHDEHGHMIVDMDDVVKEISGFDSWKAQAVPEGFVLVPREPTEEMIQAGRDERRDFGTVASTYKAMIEAVQEQSHE